MSKVTKHHQITAQNLTNKTGVRHDPRFVGWLMITGKLDEWVQHIESKL